METNLNQCCASMHSICGTCRKKFVCFEPHIEHREKCGLYEPLPNPLDEIVTETRSLNPIKEEKTMETWEQVEKAIAETEANAWKDRLKEEYAQTKKRYEKLKAYNIKLEVKESIAKTTPTNEEYYCDSLLARQQEIMANYLKVLERRAELAHIEL